MNFIIYDIHDIQKCPIFHWEREREERKREREKERVKEGFSENKRKGEENDRDI